MAKYKRWTKEEDAILREEGEKGTPVEEQARMLGISIRRIYGRRMLLRLKNLDACRRDYLFKQGLSRCGRCERILPLSEFPRTGFHICLKCQRKLQMESYWRKIERLKQDPEALAKFRQKEVEEAKKWQRENRERSRATARRGYRRLIELDPHHSRDARRRRIADDADGKFRQMEAERSRHQVFNLTDNYVRRVIADGTCLSNKDIPQELVELKRVNLLIKRAVKQQEQTEKTT